MTQPPDLRQESSDHRLLRNLYPIPPPDARTDTLIFDLDGTLVDSLPDLAAALNRVLAAEGRPVLPPDHVRSMVGDGIAKLVERGFAATGTTPGQPVLVGLVARFSADYEPRSAELTRPYAGVPELLQSLARAGWRLGVCTNKPQAATLHVLGALGLVQTFHAIAGGDRFAVRKPEPGHLTQTVVEAGSAPARAVMVGDGPQDLEGARAAGIRAIAALYGYGRERIAPADLTGVPSIHRFADLPQALAEAMR